VEGNQAKCIAAGQLQISSKFQADIKYY